MYEFIVIVCYQTFGNLTLIYQDLTHQNDDEILKITLFDPKTQSKSLIIP